MDELAHCLHLLEKVLCFANAGQQLLDRNVRIVIFALGDLAKATLGNRLSQMQPAPRYHGQRASVRRRAQRANHLDQRTVDQSRILLCLAALKRFELCRAGAF